MSFCLFRKFSGNKGRIKKEAIKKASLPLADLGLGHLFQDDFATNSNAFLLDIAVKQYLIPQNNENG